MADQAKQGTTDLRRAVLWFAHRMEQSLQNHDEDRGEQGWLDEEPVGPNDYAAGCGLTAELMCGLRKEVQELEDCFESGSTQLTSTFEATIDECVDVANFAMMLADRMRAQLEQAQATLKYLRARVGEEK